RPYHPFRCGIRLCSADDGPGQPEVCLIAVLLGLSAVAVAGDASWSERAWGVIKRPGFLFGGLTVPGVARQRTRAAWGSSGLLLMAIRAASATVPRDFVSRVCGLPGWAAPGWMLAAQRCRPPVASLDGWHLGAVRAAPPARSCMGGGPGSGLGTTTTSSCGEAPRSRDRCSRLRRCPARGARVRDDRPAVAPGSAAFTAAYRP